MSRPDLLEDRIRDAGADPFRPLDVDALWDEGQKARRRRRAGVIVAGVAAATAAVLAVPDLASVGTPEIAPGLDVAGGQDETTSDWDALSKQQAIDRLIALTARAPDIELPPPDGQALRTRSLRLTEETGWDAESNQAAPGTSTWQLSEHTLVVNAASDGWSQFGNDATTRPSGPTGRDDTRELAQVLRPQPGDRMRVGPDTTLGYGWPGDNYDQIAAIKLAELSPTTWVDLEGLAQVALDTSARPDVLRLLAAADAVRYEGVVDDLAGRRAVAFSHPHVSTSPEAHLQATPSPSVTTAGGSANRPALPTDADEPTVRSWILLSPEDGRPAGWEYFDPAGEQVEWRSEALLEVGLVPLDPQSLQDLPEAGGAS